MRFSTRLLSVTLLAGIGCGSPSPAGRAATEVAAAPAAAPRGTWFEIARTPEIVAALDTARLEPVADSGGRVWFCFEYTTPMVGGGDTTVRYRATEARLEVNCRARRARNLELHMETTSGVRTGTPVGREDWQPLDEHPLGSGVFYPACQALGWPLRPHDA